MWYIGPSTGLVNLKLADFHVFNTPANYARVMCEEITGQSKGGFIGAFDDFVQILECQNRVYRTKYFLLRYRHFIGHAVKDGGDEEGSFLQIVGKFRDVASVEKLRALPLCFFYKMDHFVSRLDVDHRPHSIRHVLAPADLHLFHIFEHLFDENVVNRLMDEYAVDVGAPLSADTDLAVGDEFRSFLKIAVRHDDAGGVPAKFHREALDRGRCVFHNFDSDGGRADDRDHRGNFALAQMVAYDIGFARQDVDHSGGKPYIFADFANFKARERRFGAGL